MKSKHYNIRNFFFRICDFLKGNRVYNNLKQIKALSESLNQKEITAYQNKKFDKLINDVVKNVPAYKAYGNYKSILDYPVITKKTIKKNYNDFFSKKYKRKQLVEIKTSGSYSTPFSFYLTKNRRARQQAEIIYFGKYARYFVGRKHVYVRTFKKPKLKRWFQNEILISPDIINEDHLKEYRNIFKQKEIKVIIGYPTVISNVATYCLSQGDQPKDFSFEGIITTSETLSETARENMIRCFGVNPRGRYSSQELGVIAHECPKCGLYHINYASHIVEILEMNSNQNAKPGKLGRIVVTDLYNDSFPLIRYNTGDLAQFIPAYQNSCKVNCLSNLSGRSVEFVYTTEGAIVTRLMIDHIFDDYPEKENIIQYQFSQEKEKEYILKLQVIEKEIKVNGILTSLKKILGNEASVKVEFVDYITPLKSGKRPYIINNYKKTV